MADPKIQQAVVEKGIEVAGKMVDKQLQIIDEAQQKAADFLKKEVRENLRGHYVTVHLESFKRTLILLTCFVQFQFTLTWHCGFVVNLVQGA